jgi:hypothetical protein
MAMLNVHLVMIVKDPHDEAHTQHGNGHLQEVGGEGEDVAGSEVAQADRRTRITSTSKPHRRREQMTGALRGVSLLYRRLDRSPRR